MLASVEGLWTPPSKIDNLSETESALGLLLQVLLSETEISTIEDDSLLAGLGRGLVGMANFEGKGVSAERKYKYYFRYYASMSLCLEDNRFASELEQLDTPTSTMRRLLERCRQELDKILSDIEQSGAIPEATMTGIRAGYGLEFTDARMQEENPVSKNGLPQIQIGSHTILLFSYTDKIMGCFESEEIRQAWVNYCSKNTSKETISRFQSVLNGLILLGEVLYMRKPQLDANHEDWEENPVSVVLAPVFELRNAILNDQKLSIEEKQDLIKFMDAFGEKDFEF